ncbi:MAG: hypothetical protein Q9209_002454 [Squamulea sp. 1 TL-2023]
MSLAQIGSAIFTSPMLIVAPLSVYIHHILRTREPRIAPPASILKKAPEAKHPQSKRVTFRKEDVERDIRKQGEKGQMDDELTECLSRIHPFGVGRQADGRMTMEATPILCRHGNIGQILVVFRIGEVDQEPGRIVQEMTIQVPKVKDWKNYGAWRSLNVYVREPDGHMDSFRVGDLNGAGYKALKLAVEDIVDLLELWEVFESMKLSYACFWARSNH